MRGQSLSAAWARAGGLDRGRVRAAAIAATVVIGLLGGLCAHGIASRADAVKVVITEDGVYVGSRRAPSTIDLITDPLCVPCGRLANASAADIRKAVRDKKIAVHYHLLNDFDSQSASGDYSTRALAASLCVADSGEAEHYQAFYAALFAPDFQPKPKSRTDPSTDRSNAELVELARKTGAPSTVGDCITGGRRTEAAKAEGTKALDLLKRLTGLTLVPQVYLGDREVDYGAAGWIDNLR
ncbi:hypothetical protein A5712_24465 [Mycobacterium sp. E2327]|uniref:DsbA family protein n=1 Tax=Mycobacterium sp. E2327 TaxID=1834132 RepID=UPI0008023E66|nr:thioredoxin domain-containing protein [Mycobacterium sp. E2327]OBI17136.1 hypothetical protein A5712_24465 [Mycobacterium sp. E2327]